jgi:hypothetical protein
MTLRERLEAAKADRRRAAGLPVDDAADPSATADVPWYGPEPLPRLDLRGLQPVVDLRGTPGHADPVHSSLTEALSVSDSSACPACNTEGRLDLQDIAGGVDHYTCPNCMLLFQVVR